MVTELQERLIARRRITEGGCWDWTGSAITANRGRRYGEITYRGKRQLTHRAAYEAWVGPIPEGLTIDHLCRNTRCFNPGHLEAVTLKVNLLRGVSPMAQNARKTHCPKGHAYDGENVRVSPRGRRYCRACERIRFATRTPV